MPTWSPDGTPRIAFVSDRAHRAWPLDGSPPALIAGGGRPSHKPKPAWDGHVPELHGELRLEAAGQAVFVNGKGRRRRLGDVQCAFRKARERAALFATEEGEAVFHSLRHTGIS